MNGIEHLLQQPAGFLAQSGPESDVVISTRIRLARNLRQFNFPAASTPEERIEICAIVDEAAGFSDELGKNGMLEFYLQELSSVEREILLERHLSSHDHLQKAQGAMLLCSSDESVSVMVNEEDHLRLQLLKPGLQLEDAWKSIDRLDNELGEHLAYAFDDRLGYLSSCPTNTGTGMRASVMLHLPALALSGVIPATLNGIAQLNLTVRGLWGEGSSNCGNLFQVSNKFTLGEKEESLISELAQVVEQLIRQERAARRLLLAKEQSRLLDHIGRSYGILRYSYLLDLPEASDALSMVRLGVDMGMFRSIDLDRLNDMMVTVNPGHLQKFFQREIPEQEQPQFRAAYCREQLKKAKKR